MTWEPERSVVVKPSELISDLAKSFYEYLVGPASEIVRLKECRDSENLEYVSFEIDVPRPQRPVYEIAEMESITVLFEKIDPSRFSVFATRSNFPDTPHQNIVPKGFPCCLCIDDRPWQDVKYSYSGSEILLRIQTWLDNACQGELHGVDQPFDPLFLPNSGHEIILQNDFFSSATEEKRLYMWANDPEAYCLFVSGTDPSEGRGPALPIHVAHIKVNPVKMRRISRSPRNLGDLAGFLESADIDLKEILTTSIQDWRKEALRSDPSVSVTCLLVTVPHYSEDGVKLAHEETIAFILTESAETIGEAIGLLAKNDTGESSKINYVDLFAPRVTLDKAWDFPVYMSFVHSDFNAASAAIFSGHQDPDPRKVVMVGAGSIGSALSESLARQGMFSWTIIDDDRILPHNIAKHTLDRSSIGAYKADALAYKLHCIREDSCAKRIVDNVLSPIDIDSISESFSDADIIIDASASVPVSRWIADLETEARAVCAFFTPNGTSAVLMIEDGLRACTLREIEAAYLTELIANPDMSDHLGPVEKMRYTGACRAITSRTPVSNVQALSGLMSSSIISGLDSDTESLSIWTLDNGGVKRISVDCRSTNFIADEWSVYVPTFVLDGMKSKRTSMLPLETGGALMGMIDFSAKRIDIVVALPPPADSVSTRDSFTRGTSGLKSSIALAEKRSGGQIRYIGEWHSHPEGFSSEPSGTDVIQILKLSEAMIIDGLPALTMIIAEEGVSCLVGHSIAKSC